MYAGSILEEKPLDMRQFDPSHIVEVAERCRDEVHTPRQRQILQNFIDHARAEAHGDYDTLMASCSRKRQSYTAYGAGEGYQAGLPQSYEELVHHYRALIEMNIYLIHFEVEKLFVGEDELVVEGIVHQLYPSELITGIYGIDVEDPQGVYQLTKRTCIFFVFDEDGRGCGEHAYSNGPTSAANITRVPPELVPEAFYHNPLKQVS